MARKRTKVVQKSLEQTGQLPLLKKPIECVGKHLKLPGSYWGSSCPAGDKDKTFVIVVKDFTTLHTFSSTKRGALGGQ